MAFIYVARSAKLGKWASDVGLGKHIYKVGVAEDPKAALAEAWAGESDWTVVKKEPADDLDEDAVIERLGKRETAVDPRYYPRIRETRGLFKVNPVHVESHIIVGRAMEGGAERVAIKLKPADFASYLIHNAKR
jgi:ABC-type phosphonate transport system ATPase subunit